MKSRGGPVADADLNVGDEVFLDWGFKQTKDKEWIEKEVTKEVKITFASQAAHLAASALLAIGLITSSN